MKPNDSPEKLICESCGKEFTCGANISKCWCFEVNVEVAQLEQLRENFQNCLCRDCLSKHKSNQIVEK